MTLFVIFAAIAVCWSVQLFFTWRQATRFMAAVKSLRETGTVSIGVGGKRYRGGRAYIAISVDETGTVVAALRLRGLTVFASPKPVPELVGWTARGLRRNAEVTGLRANEREAAKAAAEMLRKSPAASDAGIPTQSSVASNSDGNSTARARGHRTTAGASAGSNGGRASTDDLARAATVPAVPTGSGGKEGSLP